jgi:ribonuclease HII
MLICGVDEAGRGPIAGPVFAAAVILDDRHPIEGLADSKTLTEKKREALSLLIQAHALAWAVGRAEVEEIDSINILQASLLAMKRAVEGLPLTPGKVLIDGLHCPQLTLPTESIVGGDGSVAQISAASILAKTARDAEMRRLHRRFPQYGFERHKGYPTREHLAALERFGTSPVHRRSFGPVRQLAVKGRRTGKEDQE